MANPLATFSNIGLVGGLTLSCVVARSGLSLTSIQDGPCQVMGGSFGNVNAAVRFVKLFDVSAAQVAQTTSGLFGATAVQCFIIPGSTAGGGSNFSVMGLDQSAGLQFFNGCAMEFTQNISLADHSGIQIGDCVANLWLGPS